MSGILVTTVLGWLRYATVQSIETISSIDFRLDMVNKNKFNQGEIISLSKLLSDVAWHRLRILF